MTIIKKVALVCALTFSALQFSTRVHGFVITTGVLAGVAALTAGIGLAGAVAGLGATAITSVVNSIKGDPEEA